MTHTTTDAGHGRIEFRRQAVNHKRRIIASRRYFTVVDQALG